jgi:hypothetical protein
MPDKEPTYVSDLQNRIRNITQKIDKNGEENKNRLFREKNQLEKVMNYRISSVNFIGNNYIPVFRCIFMIAKLFWNY